MELYLVNVEGKNVYLDKLIRYEGNWNFGMVYLYRILYTLVRGLIFNFFNFFYRYIFLRGDSLFFR